MSKKKRLEYIPMYHEPKIRVVEVSSPQKKKPQQKKHLKKAAKSNILFTLGSLFMIVGIIILFSVGAWNALGGYDMTNIVFFKNTIPAIICFIIGLVLHRIDGKEVKR